MRHPDTDNPAGHIALENDSDPPWVTLEQMEHELDPWLVRDSVELTLPEKDQVALLLASDADFVLALRGGAYEGIIEGQRAIRGIVRQIATQAGG
jgi:hypothetical protein